MVVGRKDAPLLVIMPFDPGEGMTRWFYGRAKECGFVSTDIRIVHILEERPALSGLRASVAQMTEATPRVMKDLAESRPRVVVPLGSEALYFATGLKQGIVDARGYLLSPDLRSIFMHREWGKIGEYKRGDKKKNREKGDPRYGWIKRALPGLLPAMYKGWVIPTFTLHHIQTSGFSLAPAFKIDLKRARRALDGQLNQIGRDLRFFNSFTHRRDVDRNLYAEDLDTNFGPVLAVDIETIGPEHRVIERVGVSDGDKTVSLPWNAETLNWLNAVMSVPREWILFHNRPFDVPRLREAGVVIREGNIFDTMYGAVIPHPELPKGLGRMVPLYCDVPPWKWYADEDPELYNALDAFYTVRAFEDGLKPLISNLRMWPLVTGQGFKWGPGIMATIPVLSGMTESGIRKNKPFAETWAKQLSSEMLPLLQQWTEMFPDVDPTSPKQLMKLFYTTWGLPIIRNKKKIITTDELAIIKLREYLKTPYALTRDSNHWKSDSRCNENTFDLLLKMREVNKNADTYCSPFLEDDRDYVHPSYLPVGKDQDNDGGATATGRLASMNPNIQNQPARDKATGKAHAARHLYIPDSDDMCFIQYDFTRAEMFAMAAAAGDDVMLDDLREDPYQKVADKVGITRKIAKNVVLAGQYLAGAQKISDMILKDEHVYVPPTVCQAVLDALSAMWVKRTAYVRWLINEVNTKGYLINPFGRVRIFHDRRAAAGVNFIPQSIVADILWCVLKDVSETAERLGGRLTTTVHDSILIQVPKEKVNEAIPEVKSIMERKFDCVAEGFYLPVSVEVGAPGASWGELKEWTPQ